MYRNINYFGIRILSHYIYIVILYTNQQKFHNYCVSEISHPIISEIDFHFWHIVIYFKIYYYKGPNTLFPIIEDPFGCLCVVTNIWSFLHRVILETYLQHCEYKISINCVDFQALRLLFYLIHQHLKILFYI